MTTKDLAYRIPKKYRDKLLSENVVFKAVVSGSDDHMKVLFAIYTTYIDPEGDDDLNCSYCLRKILQYFKLLVPYLVEISKEDKILDEL